MGVPSGPIVLTAFSACVRFGPDVLTDDFL